MYNVGAIVSNDRVFTLNCMKTHIQMRAPIHESSKLTSPTHKDE
jgi:hypothetical protein